MRAGLLFIFPTGLTNIGAPKRWVRKARVFRMTKVLGCHVNCTTNVVLQGFFGKRKNCYSIAVRAAEKAMQKMYIGRKLKKRDMRKVVLCTQLGVNLMISQVVDHKDRHCSQAARHQLFSFHEPACQGASLANMVTHWNIMGIVML